MSALFCAAVPRTQAVCGGQVWGEAGAGRVRGWSPGTLGDAAHVCHDAGAGLCEQREELAKAAHALKVPRVVQVLHKFLQGEKSVNASDGAAIVVHCVDGLGPLESYVESVAHELGLVWHDAVHGTREVVQRRARSRGRGLCAHDAGTTIPFGQRRPGTGLADGLRLFVQRVEVLVLQAPVEHLREGLDVVDVKLRAVGGRGLRIARLVDDGHDLVRRVGGHAQREDRAYHERHGKGGAHHLSRSVRLALTWSGRALPPRVRTGPLAGNRVPKGGEGRGTRPFCVQTVRDGGERPGRGDSNR